MRVARHLRSEDSERGAVAVIVAVCLVMLLSAAAIAVDAGAIWANRRNMVTVTDAAALAAAQTFAREDDGDDDGCNTVDDTYASYNLASAEVTSCEASVDGINGQVTVEAHNEADLFFAQIWGQSTRDVPASTTAEWGYPSSVTGLRPYALCVESDVFQGWTDRTEEYGPVTINYTKDSPNDCGGDAPGNWGTIDFDGGSNSNSDTQDWVEYGYDGWVEVGDHEGDTGAFATGQFPQTIVGLDVTLPLYDQVTGNGANTQFHIIGFVHLHVEEIHESNQQDERYMVLTFKPGIVSGSCCGTPVIDTGIRAVGICAVDPTTSCS